MKNLLLLLGLLICGTTFSQLWKSMVGSMQFGLADEQEYAILDNNRPVVAINKTGGNTVAVFLWDGQTWQNLTQIVPDPITDLQVSNDGNTPIVGFFNTNVGKYQVWSWDGTNWNILGDTGLSVYHPNSVRMIAGANSGEYYISYVSDISKEANMQKWNGSSWPSFGNNFDPFINDLQFLHPGSDGSKLWALSEDFGSGGELRLWNSPEAVQSWSWYSNAPAENENIMADMTVEAGHPPMISLVKSSTPGTVNTIRANGGPGFNPVPQNIVIAGGIDEISTALNNADVEHVFVRETGSTDGKLFEFSTGSWASVGGPVHTNGMDSRLALHVPSGKPYVLYNKDGEATLKAFNTKPSYSSDSGIQSVCQDATGASVFSNITFNDTDYDSLFISAVSNTPSVLTSANITVTRTNPYSPTSAINDFKIDVTPQPGIAGTASVDLFVIDGIDTLTYPIVIVVNPLPTVNAGVDQVICEANGVILSGSGAISYLWDNSVINNATFFPAVGTLTYTVIGTDGNGCQNNDVVNVTVNAKPSYTVSHTDLTCNGLNDGTLIFTGLIPSQNFDVYYTYGAAQGPFNVNSNTGGIITLGSLTPGNYNGFIIVDANGCQGSVGAGEIILEPSVVSSIPIADQFICDGNSLTLSGSGSGGTPGYTYTWDNGVIDGVAFSPAVGTITYNLTIMDANGCQVFDNTNVTVNVLPTVDGGIDQTVCDGTTVTFNGSGAISYLWDNGVSDGVPFTATVGVTVYTVTGTDGNGCQNTDNLTLTVNSLPTVFAGSDQIVCENDNITLTGSGASTYIWDNGVTDGVSFNQAIGIVTYTVTGTDINGCQNTDAVDVTANPAPPIFTLNSNSPSICGSSDGTMTISGLAFSTIYDVSYDNPSTQGPFTLTSDPSGNIVISGLSAGAYSNITVTGANTCSTIAGASEIISDPAAPTIIAGVDQTICEGQSVVLTATNPDNALISWDNFVTDGVPTSPAATTTYTVTANSSGCVSTDQLTVTVNPLPAIGISTTDETCGANDGSATATITNGLPPYSIYWSNGSTTTTTSDLSGLFYYVNVTDANNCYAMAVAPIGSSALSLSGVVVNNNCQGDSNGSIDLSVSGTGPFKYYWSNGLQVEDISGLTAGQYEVYVEDVNGCSTTASFVINEPSEIISNYTPTAATCGNADGSIVAAIIGGTIPYTFQWLDNTQTIIPGATLSTLSGTAADIYFLNITDANGCISQMATALSEIGGPIVTADSLGASTCANDGFININVNTSNTIVSTIWTSGQTTEDLTNIGDGNYSVTVLDNIGCKGLANFNVGQVKPIAAPICIVTVDTNTNTNKIVWEKPISTNISEFRIYRESSIAGSFQFVDAVSYSSLSEYNDTIAYSSLRSWRYVLTTVDSCGVESLKSEDHKTIHYTSTDDGLGNYELFWDEYEGFTYPTYFIWRFTDVNGWEEIHTEPYGGTLSYIDAPPSIVDLNYVVIIEPASTCTSTLKATDYNSSRSNKNYSNFFPDDDDSGIELNELAFEVYPNPSTGQFMVNTSGINVYTIDIIDFRGRTILSYNDVKGNQKIDLSDFESGTYLIKLTSLDGTGNQKIIKQ